MIARLKSLGLAYVWGLLNFFAGTVIGAAWMYLAIVASLKANGINV